MSLVEGANRQGAAIRILVLLTVLFITASCPMSRGQRYHNFVTRTPLEAGETLILGFLGGRDSWNDRKPGVGRLATRLRSLNLKGVHLETVENKKRNLALELVHNALDRDRNAKLDLKEKSTARIILYGQSFGGAAVVKFARQLEQGEIPVLLTVQIDSVGRQDDIIPPNVRSAANLFQKNGIFIRGEPKIQAQDPSQTVLVSNLEFDYRTKKIDLSKVPWYKKIFRVAHTKMDRDPDVWVKVEELILETLASNN